MQLSSNKYLLNMTISYCPYCQTNREKRNYIDPFTQIIYSKCSTCSRIIQREIQRQNKISYMNESNQQQETIQEKKTQTKRSRKAKMNIIQEVIIPQSQWIPVSPSNSKQLSNVTIAKFVYHHLYTASSRYP